MRIRCPQLFAILTCAKAAFRPLSQLLDIDRASPSTVGDLRQTGRLCAFLRRRPGANSRADWKFASSPLQRGVFLSSEQRGCMRRPAPFRGRLASEWEPRADGMRTNRPFLALFPFLCPALMQSHLGGTSDNAQAAAGWPGHSRPSLRVNLQQFVLLGPVHRQIESAQTRHDECDRLPARSGRG